MRTLYFPNIYRHNEYRLNEMNTEINYAQKNMTGEIYKTFRVGVTFRLIEQMLYYDRIYIDLLDIPDLLNVLDYLDMDFLVEAAEKGYFSFVNGYDTTIGVSKKNLFGVLSYGMGEYGKVKNVEELREFVFFRYTFKRNIDNILKHLMKNSIEYDKKDYVDVVNSLDKDIRNTSIRENMGIKSIDGTKILTADIPTVNALGLIYKSVKTVDDLRINTLYADDILMDIYEARFKTHFSSDAFKFNQLLKMFKLPDIELLLLYQKMSVEDVLKLKSSKDFGILYESVIKDSEDDREILSALIKATNNKISKTDYVFKILNFMTSTVAGILNPLAGVGAAITGEVISIFKDGRNHPTVALEKIADIIKAEGINVDDIPNIVSTRMKKQYFLK